MDLSSEQPTLPGTLGDRMAIRGKRNVQRRPVHRVRIGLLDSRPAQ